MAYQADSSRPWLHTGSFPSDGDNQPSISQLLLGLSGSLNSPDASSSDWHSSYADFNTSAERPSNPTFGDVTSTGVSVSELDSIDPRLLDRQQVPGDDTSPLAHHRQLSRFISVNASSEVANSLQSHIPYLHTFGLALREAEMSPDVTELSLGALSFLTVWMLLNPGRLPSTTDLKSIENLAHTRGKGKLMMDWSKNRVSIISETSILTNARGANLRQWGDETRHYRPKCVSSSRSEIQSGEPTNRFTCTNGCGQTFNRKDSWARHERNNFEEWVCYVCTAVLTRDWHLRKHLEKHPNTQGVNLEKHKRQLLAPMERPCGFCGEKFLSWEEWLVHVGAHFEGSIQGKLWKITEWEERKMTAPGPGRRRKRGCHRNGGDDDDDDGDDGDNDDDGTGANNGGGSALNSSYQASRNASGVGQGQAAGHSFGWTYAAFNGFPGGATSQRQGNVQRTPSLRSTNKVKAPVDHTQDHGMAALDVSAAKIRSAFDACAQVSSCAPSPTNSKEHPRVESLAADVSTHTVSVPSHKEKRQIGKHHTEDSSTYGNGARSATVSRWLTEKPRQEQWNTVARVREIERSKSIQQAKR
jgi:hypothetical protein